MDLWKLYNHVVWDYCKLNQLPPTCTLIACFEWVRVNESIFAFSERASPKYALNFLTKKLCILNKHYWTTGCTVHLINNDFLQEETLISRRSLLSGVSARGSKRSHTMTKCLTCCGLPSCEEVQFNCLHNENHNSIHLGLNNDQWQVSFAYVTKVILCYSTVNTADIMHENASMWFSLNLTDEAALMATWQ